MASTPVTGPVTFEHFTMDNLAELAREIAGSVHGYPPVIERRKITLDQYKTIAQNQFFVDMLRQSVQEYQRIDSAQKRAKQKAAVAFEHAIPTMGARINDPREPLEKVAQMAKVLADVGGIGSRDQTAGPQERITISIDLGADTKLTFEKSKTAAVPDITEGARNPPEIPALSEGTDGVFALRSFGERQIETSPVRSVPQGTSTSQTSQNSKETT